MQQKEISIVIPVYNEEESLPVLFEALWPVMAGLGRSFEIVFVSDGSRDKSIEMLRDFQQSHADDVVVIELSTNFGQHMAILAGFERVRGEYVITLDADMQNPPTEIPKLIAELDAGHDVVGTYRAKRHDPLFRKFVSKIANKVTNKIAKLDIRDYGCMLRGYHRRIIDVINESRESTTFIPALARRFASDPIEIAVEHSERELGVSKYGVFQLLRLNFDLMTGFSTVPLQLVTMTGMLISFFSLLLVVYMIARRIVVGPEVDGVFTLMGIQFFLTGVSLSCVGVCGEYIGRIHREVSKRPRYTVRKIYGGDENKEKDKNKEKKNGNEADE